MEKNKEKTVVTYMFSVTLDNALEVLTNAIQSLREEYLTLDNGINEETDTEKLPLKSLSLRLDFVQ